ncbi:MAG: GDP-L-fucose synthase family protein [Thermoleophilia bacterium]
MNETSPANTSTSIFVAGHRGMVGSAVRRALESRGYRNLLLRTHHELDLTDPSATRAFFKRERPEVVILAAAKVGGILANWEEPYEFIRENLAIELSTIDAAFCAGVRRLLFLGSSCIYPKLAPQPLREEYLLTGPLEETNRPYALAKIAGIELCRSLNREYGTDYLSLMPTNLYGPGDNFDLHTSHVLPALIRKFHEAKLGLPAEGDAPRPAHSPVSLWGTGSPRREFLYADDLADAVCFLLEQGHATTIPDGLINIGTGLDQTIRELALVVQRVVGHEGEIIWDEEKPDGTPQKLLDVSRLRTLGWEPRVGLEDGIRRTYEWYLKNPAPRCGENMGAH